MDVDVGHDTRRLRLARNSCATAPSSRQRAAGTGGALGHTAALRESASRRLGERAATLSSPRLIALSALWARERCRRFLGCLPLGERGGGGRLLPREDQQRHRIIRPPLRRLVIRQPLVRTSTVIVKAVALEARDVPQVLALDAEADRPEVQRRYRRHLPTADIAAQPAPPSQAWRRHLLLGNAAAAAVGRRCAGAGSLRVAPRPGEADRRHRRRLTAGGHDRGGGRYRRHWRG
mmetsp:Transcript_50763/g.146426  ORF Transcript_50763/g.146426 Transcript_50763/m.146426 type:complete len:234 (-) Transcript_50763:330-1031(-)